VPRALALLAERFPGLQARMEILVAPIMVGALRQPYSVKRGDKILLVYDNGGLRITAAGTPLADGTTGALIQVRNTDTGVILSGTVMPDRSVLVVQK